MTARLWGLTQSFALPLPDSCTTMDQEEIKRRIVELQIEHRDLDLAIDRLAEQLSIDDLALRRMKKRKLQIKDALTQLEMRLVPDIPA
jgi:hypothetical protein